MDLQQLGRQSARLTKQAALPGADLKGIAGLLGRGAKGLGKRWPIATLVAGALGASAANEGLAQLELPHLGPKDLYNPGETYYGASPTQNPTEALGYWFARPRQSLNALFGDQKPPSMPDLLRPRMQEGDIMKPVYDPVTKRMTYNVSQRAPPAIARLLSQRDQTQNELTRLGITPSENSPRSINYNPLPYPQQNNRLSLF